MTLSNEVIRIMQTAGFNMQIKPTYEETRVLFARYMLLYDQYCDQWEVLVAEKLNLSNLNKEQLREIAMGKEA